MDFTLKTVVILIVILIIALIAIGLLATWGAGGKNVLESFFNWVTGGSSKP